MRLGTPKTVPLEAPPISTAGLSVPATAAEPYIQMDARKFQCRICGEIRTTRTKVMRHILAHFLPDEIARMAEVNIVERPL